MNTDTHTHTIRGKANKGRDHEGRSFITENQWNVWVQKWKPVDRQVKAGARGTGGTLIHPAGQLAVNVDGVETISPRDTVHWGKKKRKRLREIPDVGVSGLN